MFLPVELLDYTLAFLDYRSLVACCRVNHAFKRQCCNHQALIGIRITASFMLAPGKKISPYPLYSTHPPATLLIALYQGRVSQWLCINAADQRSLVFFKSVVG